MRVSSVRNVARVFFAHPLVRMRDSGSPPVLIIPQLFGSLLPSAAFWATGATGLYSLYTQTCVFKKLTSWSVKKHITRCNRTRVVAIREFCTHITDVV